MNMHSWRVMLLSIHLSTCSKALSDVCNIIEVLLKETYENSAERWFKCTSSLNHNSTSTLKLLTDIIFSFCFNVDFSKSVRRALSTVLEIIVNLFCGWCLVHFVQYHRVNLIWEQYFTNIWKYVLGGRWMVCIPALLAY